MNRYFYVILILIPILPFWTPPTGQIESKKWPTLKTYSGEYLSKVAMPIGGIGTGTVSLGGMGDLRDWEIENQGALCWKPVFNDKDIYVAPFTGKKGSTLEGGVRMPTLVRRPGNIPQGSVNDQILTTMDLLPTFANLAGAEIPTDIVLDRQDILPVLAANEESPHKAFFYYNQEELEAIRSGEWKLRIAVKESPALYNSKNDISESTDVLLNNPDIVDRLRTLALELEKELERNRLPAAFVENSKPLSV